MAKKKKMTAYTRTFWIINGAEEFTYCPYQGVGVLFCGYFYYIDDDWGVWEKKPTKAVVTDDNELPECWPLKKLKLTVKEED